MVIKIWSWFPSDDVEQKASLSQCSSSTKFLKASSEAQQLLPTHEAAAETVARCSSNEKAILHTDSLTHRETASSRAAPGRKTPFSRGATRG